MITKLEKAAYLNDHGYTVKQHRKLQKSGHIRVYIDEIDGVKFTTSSADQTTASRTLDALYWGCKLQEDKYEEESV